MSQNVTYTSKDTDNNRYNINNYDTTTTTTTNNNNNNSDSLLTLFFHSFPIY